MLSDVHRDVAQTSGGEDGLAVVAQHSPGCGGEVGGGDPTEYIREEVESDIVEVVNKAGTALDGQDGPYFPRPTDVEADQACAELRRRIISATWSAPRTSLVVRSHQRRTDRPSQLVLRVRGHRLASDRRGALVA